MGEKTFKCSICKKILAEFSYMFGNINVPCMCDIWEKKIIEIESEANKAWNTRPRGMGRIKGDLAGDERKRIIKIIDNLNHHFITGHALVYVSELKGLIEESK